jgi:hypothetical protein
MNNRTSQPGQRFSARLTDDVLTRSLARAPACSLTFACPQRRERAE